MAKQRDLIESWGNLKTTLQMCKRAWDKQKNKDFKRLLESLDLYWRKFNADYEIYKEDIISKTAKSESNFNAVIADTNGDNVSAYTYNDHWKDEQFEKYAEMRDSLQDRIDELESSDTANSLSLQSDTCNLDNTIEQTVLEIKIEIDSIESTIVNIESEVLSFNDGTMASSLAAEHKTNVTRVLGLVNQEFKSLVHAKLAMQGESADPEYSNEKIQAKYRDLNIGWKKRLNSLFLIIAKKTIIAELPERKVSVLDDTSLSPTDLSASRHVRETVHLEKTKPPKFDGIELEYPEFKRKWLAQVSKAGLPEESELDKLRDAVPRQAKDMLFGVTQLVEAWKVLDQRYGNKDVISRKLKDQLKNIVCEGSNDPEKLMDLKIKVKNVVTRLETMGLQADLSHDREFLSAVYNAMPQRYRVKWLDLEKSDDKWSDMITFLDNTYSKALEEISLLSTISGTSKKVK